MDLSSVDDTCTERVKPHTGLLGGNSSADITQFKKILPAGLAA